MKVGMPICEGQDGCGGVEGAWGGGVRSTRGCIGAAGERSRLRVGVLDPHLLRHHVAGGHDVLHQVVLPLRLQALVPRDAPHRTLQLLLVDAEDVLRHVAPDN